MHASRANLRQYNLREVNRDRGQSLWRICSWLPNFAQQAATTRRGVDLEMKICFLSNWNDMLLVEPSASVWMHIQKHKLDVNTRDPISLLHNRARCFDRHAAGQSIFQCRGFHIELQLMYQL